MRTITIGIKLYIYIILITTTNIKNENYTTDRNLAAYMYEL